MKRSISATVVVLALLLAAVDVRAEVIERVVAVVNDKAIFLSDLRQRAAPFLPRVMAAPSEVERMAAIEQLYNQLLERMVQEELFIQAAERMQVSVTRAEVDRAVGNVQRQARLSDADFWEAVRGQGFSPEQYRADVRRQLLRLKVLNMRARGRVNITDEQVRERYDTMVARQQHEQRYRAAQIFIPVAAEASEADLAAARDRITQVRAQISTADQFEMQMASIGGGDLGWLSQGDLPEVLEEEIRALEVGVISQPIRGPSGLHIFLVRERQSGSDVPSYEQLRTQIYSQMMEEAMTQQEETFLAELRRQAVVDLRL